MRFHCNQHSPHVGGLTKQFTNLFVEVYTCRPQWSNFTMGHVACSVAPQLYMGVTYWKKQINTLNNQFENRFMDIEYVEPLQCM